MYPHQFTTAGKTFHYAEFLAPEQKDYQYEISIVIELETIEEGVVFITKNGVSVWFDKGGSIMTNIRPEGLFKGKTSLTKADLIKIVKLINNIGCEGKYIPK